MPSVKLPPQWQAAHRARTAPCATATRCAMRRWRSTRWSIRRCTPAVFQAHRPGSRCARCRCTWTCSPTIPSTWRPSPNRSPRIATWCSRPTSCSARTTTTTTISCSRCPTRCRGNGLEHHRSSEDGEGTGYFTEWDSKRRRPRPAAARVHAFVERQVPSPRRPVARRTSTCRCRTACCGSTKARRSTGATCWPARSGLRTPEQARDALALVAAAYTDNRAGLSWRALQDTTNDPIIAQRRPKPLSQLAAAARTTTPPAS